VEYESRRKDSPAYTDHLTNLHDFATSALDSALFMRSREGNQYEATNPMNMTSPRAEDFRAHFPYIAEQLDQWNKIADGYKQSIDRYTGTCHRESERATGDVQSSLHSLLWAIGQGDVDVADVIWRVDNGRLEASWQLDVDDQPAFAPIATKGLTNDIIDSVWETVRDFPNLPAVHDWRTRVDGKRQLRFPLIDSLERVEITFDLKGKCQHCPP
jgi:hypothetical protein